MIRIIDIVSRNVNAEYAARIHTPPLLQVLGHTHANVYEVQLRLFHHTAVQNNLFDVTVMEVAQRPHTRHVLRRCRPVRVTLRDSRALPFKRGHRRQFIPGRLFRATANHRDSYRLMNTLPGALRHEVGVECTPEFTALQALRFVCPNQLRNPAPPSRP